MNPTPPAEASEWVRRWSHLVAPGAQVLDLACGSGRHMQWFAARGHAVLGVDRSAQALQGAAAFGEVLACDLEAAPWPLAGRQFGAVVVTNYLWRPLLAPIVESVAPGGVLLYETFAQGNAAFGRPANPDFLLAPGELLRACQALRVVAYEEGFLAPPERLVQRIAALRVPDAPGDPRRCALAAPR